MKHFKDKIKIETVTEDFFDINIRIVKYSYYNFLGFIRIKKTCYWNSPSFYFKNDSKKQKYKKVAQYLIDEIYSDLD